MKSLPFLITAVIVLLACAAACRSSKEVVAHQEHTEQIHLQDFDSLTIYLAQAFHCPAVASASGVALDTATPPRALVPVAAVARRRHSTAETAVEEKAEKKVHWEAPHLDPEATPWGSLGAIGALIIILTLVVLSIRR